MIEKLKECGCRFCSTESGRRYKRKINELIDEIDSLKKDNEALWDCIISQ